MLVMTQRITSQFVCIRHVLSVSFIFGSHNYGTCVIFSAVRSVPPSGRFICIRATPPSIFGRVWWDIPLHPLCHLPLTTSCHLALQSRPSRNVAQGASFATAVRRSDKNMAEREPNTSENMCHSSHLSLGHLSCDILRSIWVILKDGHDLVLSLSYVKRVVVQLRMSFLFSIIAVFSIHRLRQHLR